MVTGVEPGGGGFVVAQPGAGGDQVEDLHDLGAEAAGELAGPAEGVLAGDPALLVRGGAQRQVGLAEQPVVGDHAVPGGAHVRQAGAHRRRRRRSRPRRRVAAPASASRSVSGRTPTTTRTRSASAGDGCAVGCRGRRRAAARSAGARLMRRDGGAGEDLDAVAVELGVDEGAEFGVDGGQHLGELLDLGDREAADGQGVRPSPGRCSRRRR